MYVVPCTLCKLHMRVNRFDKAQRVKNQTGKRYANHEKSDKLFATQLSLGKRAVAASTTDGSDGHRHSSHSCTKIMQITYTYYNVLYYTVYIYMYAVEWVGCGWLSEPRAGFVYCEWNEHTRKDQKACCFGMCWTYQGPTIFHSAALRWLFSILRYTYSMWFFFLSLHFFLFDMWCESTQEWN